MPGSTGVQTGAQEAWALRKGVCQDIAHLTVGLLRALGIPARYVSGYLHPSRTRPIGDDRRRARATPGSSGGAASGRLRPDQRRRRSATGTWWSPGAATTPTSRRSRASTTARPRPRSSVDGRGRPAGVHQSRPRRLMRRWPGMERTRRREAVPSTRSRTSSPPRSSTSRSRLVRRPGRCPGWRRTSTRRRSRSATTR